jgi:hypothetical protein
MESGCKEMDRVIRKLAAAAALAGCFSEALFPREKVA